MKMGLSLKRTRSCFEIFLLVAASGIFANSQSDSETQQAWSHYKEALQYFRQQNLEKAQQEASLALELAPRMAEAENLLGVIARDSGKLVDAEIHFTRSLKIRPKFTQAHFNLAGTYLKLNQVEKAGQEFETVLRLEPTHPGAHFYLGVSLRNAKRPREAIVHLEKACQLDPTNVELLMGLLDCQLDLELQSESEKSTREIYRLIEARDPRMLRLGALLANRGAYALAITTFQRVLKEDPNSYDANYNLALSFFLSNDSENAEGVLNRVLLQHNVAEAHNLLARVLEKDKKYTQALTEYERAATLEPRNEDFRFDHCLKLFEHASVDLGISQLTQAVRDFPKSGRIQAALGAGYYLKDQNDKALEHLLYATEVTPSLSQSYYYLGNLYKRVDATHQKTIMEKLKSYLVLVPNDPYAHYFYGVGLFENETVHNENFSEAATQFQKTISLKSDFAPAYYRLGVLYNAQGRTADSLIEFERAAKADPRMHEAHYRLGIAYSKLGESEKAEREFQTQAQLLSEAGDQANERRGEFLEIITSPSLTLMGTEQ